MKQLAYAFFLWLCSSCVLVLAKPADVEESYLAHPEAQVWRTRMEAEGFSRQVLDQLLREARKQTSILRAMDRPAEKRLDWGEYRQRFIQPKQVSQGVAFWNAHEEALSRAESVYGVPPEVIVAIIGIETRYGKNMGSFRALDALATLSFDYPRRAEFFQGQLKDLLILAEAEKRDIRQLKSSYAGAMGYGQFIPSSFLKYAVDFDRDGSADIWDNPVDAIGSVANYFLAHGWQTGAPVASLVAVGRAPDESWVNTGLPPKRLVKEWRDLGVSLVDQAHEASPAVLLRMMDQSQATYWLGFNNFYTITRYNRSRLYAMAVYQLSREIAAAKQL